MSELKSIKCECGSTSFILKPTGDYCSKCGKIFGILNLNTTDKTKLPTITFKLKNPTPDKIYNVSLGYIDEEE